LSQNVVILASFSCKIFFFDLLNKVGINDVSSYSYIEEKPKKSQIHCSYSSIFALLLIIPIFFNVGTSKFCIIYDSFSNLSNEDASSIFISLQYAETNWLSVKSNSFIKRIACINFNSAFPSRNLDSVSLWIPISSAIDDSIISFS